MRFRKPLAFLKRDFIIALNYKFSFVLQLLGVFFSTAMFYFLSQVFGKGVSTYLEPYGGDYFAFVLIGIAFSSYLSFSLRSFSAQLRESQLQGTLEALLATPTSLSTIMLSSSLYPFLFTSFSVIVYFVFGAAVFGFPMGNANIPVAVLILILSIVSFSGLGILSAAFTMVFKKGSPISWLLSSLSMFLCGTFYPVSVLPSWLQKFSCLLPLTYSLHGMRYALLQNYSLTQLLPDIGALLLFSLVLLPLGLVAFSYATKRAKIEGSLAQY